MVDKNSIIIRKFKTQDREAVRRISYETAFIGKSSSIFFDGDEIVADALTMYFTDHEPDSCFVAELSGKVIGYLIGAKNISILKEVSQTEIFPRLFLNAFTQGAFIKKKNIIFIFHILLSLLKSEFNEPDFSNAYPATLHINIQEGFRNLGAGPKLISAYLDYLTGEKICGVHLATLSDTASNFFSKQGLSLLYRSQRSYFRYILHNDITIYIYGKRLLN